MNKKLTMLSSHEGSPDGVRHCWYVEGRTYEVSESLAKIFLREGWAKPEPCIGDDPACPCQDGAMCHYTGPNAWPLPAKAEMAPGHKAEYAKAARKR
jgi:hypothetical protein